ncbi:MAG: fibronectin type III domain-containing protein, partial [Anaerolineae bacterium]|nr:fibronectin type III domain-containing protein [Anaerolineae bacterium]
VQSILVVASALADGPQPPRNIALRQTDGGTPMLVWEPVQGATGYIITLRYAGSERYDQQIGIDDPSQTSLVWDRFPEYAGISVAARGADGIIGRLSPEYSIQPG